MKTNGRAVVSQELLVRAGEVVVQLNNLQLSSGVVFANNEIHSKIGDVEVTFARDERGRWGLLVA